MSKTIMVKINLEELKTLKKRSEKLSFLECDGVDNWEGYGENFDGEDGEESLDTIEESIDKETINEYEVVE